MSYLATAEKERLQTLFKEELIRPLRLVVTGWERGLIDELASASSKLHIETRGSGGTNLYTGGTHLALSPSLFLLDERGRDVGVRFFGLPLGYEFSGFIQTLLMAAGGPSPLTPETRTKALTLPPATVDLFVADNCPYCPRAVAIVCGLALAAPNVEVSVIDAKRFGEFSQRRNVNSVPDVVVNGEIHIQGVPTEEQLLGAVRGEPL